MAFDVVCFVRLQTPIELNSLFISQRQSSLIDGDAVPYVFYQLDPFVYRESAEIVCHFMLLIDWLYHSTIRIAYFPFKEGNVGLHRDLYLPRLDGQGHPLFRTYFKAQRDGTLDVGESLTLCFALTYTTWN